MNEATNEEWNENFKIHIRTTNHNSNNSDQYENFGVYYILHYIYIDRFEETE